MDLPAEVKNAIHANRKIDAIKLLRNQWDLELKEAKKVVDDYVLENRHLIDSRRVGRRSGIGRILIIIVLGGTLYAVYRAFA